MWNRGSRIMSSGLQNVQDHHPKSEDVHYILVGISNAFTKYVLIEEY
jgi:hypothetical protein